LQASPLVGREKGRAARRGLLLLTAGTFDRGALVARSGTASTARLGL